MGIYIALGSNLPFNTMPPQDVLRAALTDLPGVGVRVAAVSRFWRSPAWPDPSAPAYVNAVARVETDLQPRALLKALQAVETKYGRQRSVPNASRTLDLDILDYGGLFFDEAGLVLPHPRLAERAFVLLPLQDIAPDWVEPGEGRTLDQLVRGLAPAEAAKLHLLENS
ncbi:2-amino-4-hydroxy-6-hydroxymethyldihydropteridine diphosphokinase [Hyphobacterium marinum]|uniref:2-amino-4-hydroxy-6-hydroxymethyldihydropteridine pyrophosphokinase n=1 Tax=Hyphobacterium marinum TaxID=3116574 RepID=A0ABU7LYT3_9PROT|nr:2-amino-4-hydroxy-6-hydroxymethyldihydropteridine diphosphokinase [Hyphobacterium sp. Y6023]MEE2566713.1 2-amino-4-hydroxy-6-hydroxymethyldihydropteridine diphosphokinase [Hyphobacterium sp. Y6023]